MIISLFEIYLPWLAAAATLLALVTAVQGTRRKSFGIAPFACTRVDDPAGYWFWFSVHWMIAVFAILITLSVFGLDVRYWL